MKVGGQYSNRVGPSHPLLATSFFKACNKALQGEAKRKYFEHSGALRHRRTAVGTDDNLIKLEGTPPGYRIQI